MSLVLLPLLAALLLPEARALGFSILTTDQGPSPRLAGSTSDLFRVRRKDAGWSEDSEELGWKERLQETAGAGLALKTLQSPLSVGSCELVGHTQLMQVSGCAPVELTVNACYGECHSFARPSSWQTQRLNHRHVLTSIGQCCNIMETKNVKVKLQCVGGPKLYTIKSAKSCACFHCKKA